MAPTKPIVEHTVDRTPEYEKFLEELRGFHEKRGTHLDPEPKMGNLSVDLYKLFNYIVQNGGYDKVSDEKLMWRKMCEGLGLMRHNAPADAYTLKQIFYKNLAAFEIKKIHNKEPPPPEILEFTTAKGGSLLTRTLENFVAKGRNDREDSEDGSTPGRERPVAETPASGRASRGLREAPAPRVIFHPDTNSSRQTRHASGAQQIGTPSSNSHAQSHSHNNTPSGHGPNHPHPGRGGAYVFNPPGPDMNNPIVQGFQPQQVQQVPLRIVDTPSSNPELFARKQRLLKQPPVAAPNPGMIVRACLLQALDGPNIYERCLLALRSGIKSEQAFGTHHLLKISHERGDKYKFSAFCGLAEGLTELALSIGSMIYHVNWTVSYDPDSDSTDIGELDGLEGTPDILERIAQLKRREDVDDNIMPAEFRDQLTLILEATQTIRNMVNMPDNAYFMSEYPPVKDLLCVLLNLPELESVVELKHLALEIAESILPYLVLRSDDPLYQSLLAKLESDDRGVILTALKALNKIALNHPIETNRLGNVPPSVLQRIMDWLLLNDEDLLDITTDFLYQYTAVVENLDTMLKHIKMENLVTHLVRLLSHGAKRSTRELVVSEARLAYDPPNETVVPTPKDLLEKLLAIEEPERCYAWIRCFFEEDPDSNITQLAIWQAYNTEFLEPLKRKGRSMISAPEFIKSITSVYESAGAQIVHEQGPGGQSQQKYLIKGIRPRRYPISPDGRGYFQCQLPAPAGAPSKSPKCGAWNLTAEKMWGHIVSEHLGQGVPRSEDGKLVNKEGMFNCVWNKCQKFPKPTKMFLAQYMAHLKTHLRDEEIRHAAKPTEVSPLAPATPGGVVPASPAAASTPTSATTKSRSGSFSSGNSNNNKSRVVRPAKTVTITLEETANARDERNPNAPPQAAGVPLSAVLILRNIAQYVPKTEAEQELRKKQRERAEKEEQKEEEEEEEGWNEILFRPVMGRLWEVFTENRLLTPHLGTLFQLLETKQVRRFIMED